MSSRVRLLPTLIGAACVLMCLRLGAMAADPPADAPKPDVSETSKPEPSAPAEDKGPADVVPPAPLPPPVVQPESAAGKKPELPLADTKGEADVLEKLGERRATLDARERDVVLREKMLVAAERQLDTKLSELKQLEQKLEALVTKRNELEEAQIASLVKTYESMKPEDAARIFNRLERGILVDVSSRMKPAKIGAVLAAMEAARAQDLTVLLARRLKIQQGSGAGGADASGGAAAAPAVPNG
jgi:flagellar motility protein MotE (MotC chaperone)